MNKDKYFGLSKRIFKWREISDFEEILAKNAENSPMGKTIYSHFYEYINPDYYNRGKEYALRLMKNSAREFKENEFNQIYDDMVYCLHKFGFSFEDYITYNLQNKTDSARNEFVPDKLRYYYCDILNSPEIKEILTDKYQCYKNYHKFFKREIVPCTSSKEFPIFKEFLSRHKKFLFKPLRAHCGIGIKLIDSQTINIEEWYYQTCHSNPGVIEELIIQDKELNRLNPSSVNTCRIISFCDGKDTVIIGGALRMGVGNSIFDNAGSGGIYASIDIDTGIIQSDAKNHNNFHFKYHPTTGTQIIGYQLPEWEQAIKLVKELATYKEGSTLISWDIAYSNKGWVIVEGNENGRWIIVQSNLEEGKKKILYTLMDKYFEKKR